MVVGVFHLLTWLAMATNAMLLTIPHSTHDAFISLALQ